MREPPPALEDGSHIFRFDLPACYRAVGLLYTHNDIYAVLILALLYSAGTAASGAL